MRRKSSRTQRRATAFLVIALIVSGIGYVGHMDAQDARAKTEGSQAYFTP